MTSSFKLLLSCEKDATIEFDSIQRKMPLQDRKEPEGNRSDQHDQKEEEEETTNKQTNKQTYNLKTRIVESRSLQFRYLPQCVVRVRDVASLAIVLSSMVVDNYYRPNFDARGYSSKMGNRYVPSLRLTFHALLAAP